MRPTARDRQQLVDEHLPFVRSIAAKLKEHLPREIEFEDLVSYGIKGLLEAAERFDRDHGTAFTTFAYYRVRGAMFDGLRSMGWLPRGEYARARVEERTSTYLGHRFDEERGDPTKAGETPRLEDELRSLSETLGGLAAVFITSLDAQPGLELVDSRAFELVERRDADQSVRRALDALPAKERRLIELYYYEDRSLEEAGQLLGLSKSWASRLHARALVLIREALEARPPAASSPASNEA